MRDSPPKVSQVDSEKGVITCSSDARNILDVRTEVVSPRVAEDKVLAYATRRSHRDNTLSFRLACPAELSTCSLSPVNP